MIFISFIHSFSGRVTGNQGGEKCCRNNSASDEVKDVLNSHAGNAKGGKVDLNSEPVHGVHRLLGQP